MAAKDSSATGHHVPNTPNYHSGNKKQMLYDTGTKQYKAPPESSGQASSTTKSTNAKADGRKNKSVDAKNRGKPWSSTANTACKATGCNKDYSRLEARKGQKRKEHKTKGDSTRKYLGNGASPGHKRAVSGLLAKSVDTNEDQAQGARRTRRKQARQEEESQKQVNIHARGRKVGRFISSRYLEYILLLQSREDRMDS